MHYFASSTPLTSDFSSTFPEAPTLYGAIDLGTNTCRMLIAQADPQATNTQGFQVIDSFSRVIRFGIDVSTTGCLSQEAIGRAITALEECASRLSMHRVQQVRCVTTAACRTAKNALSFVQQAREKTGLNLEIISPQEESFLAVAGCLDLMDPHFPYVVVFDIGGGSSEIVLAEIISAHQFRVVDWLSLPYGVLTLNNTVCSDEEKQEISQEISFEVNEFAIRAGIYDLMAQDRVQMIGASGTVTTLAAILMNLERYDRTKVHKTFLHAEDLNRLIPYLWNMKPTERFHHPCIGPQRTDFIMGGVAIFQGIYDILPVDPILVADRGVREGLLYTLMAQPRLLEAPFASPAAA